jgi:hypothetical protein
VEVEASQPIFDLLLRVFPSFKIVFLNEKLSNGQEDPENPVYLSEKRFLLHFSFYQS